MKTIVNSISYPVLYKTHFYVKCSVKFSKSCSLWRNSKTTFISTPPLVRNLIDDGIPTHTHTHIKLTEAEFVLERVLIKERLKNTTIWIFFGNNVAHTEVRGSG